MIYPGVQPYKVTTADLLNKSDLQTTGQQFDKAMTGPTTHLLASDAPVSYLSSLPLAFNNGTRDVLVSDTIDLHDAATVWPSRSLERRRAFQHLLNRCIAVESI